MNCYDRATLRARNRANAIAAAALTIEERKVEMMERLVQALENFDDGRSITEAIYWLQRNST